MRLCELSILAGSLLFSFGACSSGERADPSTGGDDASAPNPSEEPEGGVSREEDGASKEGGAKAIPCTSFEESIEAVPTPGRCAGKVAQTCDPATSTMRGEDCGPDSECKEIVLEERKFDRTGAAGWQPSRSIPWALCVPKSAAACAMIWRSGWISAETPIHTCVGDASVKCDLPGVPLEWRHTKDGWLVVVGRGSGWKVSTPCPAGETCRVAIGADEVGCFEKGAPACQASMPPRCDGTDLVTCIAEFGYERTTPCLAGRSCQSGCAGAGVCAPNGAPVCDPGARLTTCLTTTSYASCSSSVCRTEIEDCSSILTIVDGKDVNVPGRCAVIGGAPRCVRTTDVLCDPASFVERCDGAAAVRCDDGLERRSRCEGATSVCAIAGSHAGCRGPLAAPCTASQPRCEGSTLVDCCPSSGTNPISSSSVHACVPGYEIAHDCASTLQVCTSFGGRGFCVGP